MSKGFTDEFISNSVDPAKFDVINVLEDDACLYRCMALGLFTNIETINFGDKIKSVLRHENTDVSKGDIHLEDETRLAKYLQEIARIWITRNKDKIIESFGYETVTQIICNTHEIKSVKEYSDLYSIFAGDHNFIINDDGDKVNIQPRWGGIAEELAYVDLFKIDICIYVPRKKHYAEDKIIPSFMLKDGSRFVKYSELKYTGKRKDKEIPCINLLLIDRKTKPHYMFLYSL